MLSEGKHPYDYHDVRELLFRALRNCTQVGANLKRGDSLSRVRCVQSSEQLEVGYGCEVEQFYRQHGMADCAKPGGICRVVGRDRGLALGSGVAFRNRQK
jgi:hypothetical protein